MGTVWLANYVTEKRRVCWPLITKIAPKFGIASLAKSRRPPSQFLEFKWSEVKIEAELGCGTLRCVYLGKYGREDPGNVIVKKKLKGESAEAKRRFEKEAGILNADEGHRNISEFLRFSKEPYSIMMGHSCFDFTPFGVDKILNTLEEFLHFIDAEFDFTSFPCILLLCATRDVVTGVSSREKHHPQRPKTREHSGLQSTF